MIVLGLDTTGADCSVSLVDEAVVRAHISRKIGRGHAEVLAGMVADAFTAAKLKPTDVDRLAVCTGPGSFTGLRVALSFAKGFALPRSLPIVGLNALVLTYVQNAPDGKTPELIYKDIRRDELMFATYSGFSCLSGEGPRVGSDMAVQNEAEHFRVTKTEVDKIDTRILAWLAMDRDPAAHAAEPLYSRGPDAKLPGGTAPPKTKA